MCFIIIIIIHPLFLWRCVLFFLFFYSTPPPPLTTSGGRTSFTRPEVGFSGLPDGWQNVEYARPPFFFLFLLHYRLLLLVAVVPVRVFACVCVCVCSRGETKWRDFSDAWRGKGAGGGRVSGD
jgi:hypothetical protein